MVNGKGDPFRAFSIRNVQGEKKAPAPFVVRGLEVGEG